MWPPAAFGSSAASMFIVSSVLLFEIGPHHGDHLSCGVSLFRFQLPVRIDDVKTKMAFEDLGHQAVKRAAGSRDELQYLSAILFLVDGFFDSINLPLEPSHPVDELLLASNSMSHERKYSIPGWVYAIDHRQLCIQTKIMRLLKVQLKMVGGCVIGIAAQRHLYHRYRADHFCNGSIKVLK